MVEVVRVGKPRAVRFVAPRARTVHAPFVRAGVELRGHAKGGQLRPLGCVHTRADCGLAARRGDGAEHRQAGQEKGVKLVRSKFAAWRKQCLPRVGRAVLVQDHERCLWKPASLKALTDAGCDVLHKHPKYSPDLNAIEAWWNRLRQLLEKHAPTEIEGRSQFILRLRRTVNWMNSNCRDEGKRLCHGQKVRARAVIKLKGAKCRY